ncbi:hypothetical protein B0H13DRAFT_1861834 [Mycena leptocephala]|nr:hypothetical protein B0H13DRAFT_1861834 [Mycena leptocephala]
MQARRPSLSPSILLATLLLALPVDLALTILHAYLLRYPRNPRCDFHPQPHLDPGLYGSRDGFATGIHSSKRMSESLGLPRCYCDTRVADALQAPPLCTKVIWWPGPLVPLRLASNEMPKHKDKCWGEDLEQITGNEHAQMEYVHFERCIKGD